MVYSLPCIEHSLQKIQKFSPGPPEVAELLRRSLGQQSPGLIKDEISMTGGNGSV